MTGRRSQGQVLIPFDPEIEKTVRKQKEKFTHSLEQQEDSGVIENLTENSDKNIGEPQLEQEEAMALARPARALKEYSIPTLANTPSCIVVPEVEANSFELKSGMIHLLPSFYGKSNEDPNMHIREFFDICGTIKILNVSDEVVRLKLFPFSLKDRAKAWLHSLPAASINSWEGLAQKFLQKFFPAQKTNQLRRDIMHFTQGEQEPFYEAWERFRELLQKCPHHGITDWMQMHFFYEGLTIANKRMVDSACGGALMEKTPQEAFDQFDLLANNNQQWGTERTKKVGVHEVDTNTMVAAQISGLEKKLETLMRAVIPPSPQQVCAICSDPTHPMELCPSTTQGSEQVLHVNSFQRPRNDPYSNTYNPGWRNHPNFSWGSQQQQNISTRPIQHQGQPSSEPKKPALEDLITQFVQTSQQNQNAMQASITKLETQVGQLATIVHERVQGTFPSQPEINPRNSEHAKAIRTLRSGKSYGPQERDIPSVGHVGDHVEKSIEDADITSYKQKIVLPTSSTTVAAEKPYMPPLPFPHRVHKQKKDQHMFDILEIFKKVHINIPLLQAIQQL